MKVHTGRKNIIPVTEMMVQRIRKWAKPEFDPTVLSYPLGLCATCKKDLSNCEVLGYVNETKKKVGQLQATEHSPPQRAVCINMYL